MDISILMNNIFDQAEIYLKELGEFAPFASRLSKNGEVIPVGYFEDNKIIDSSKAVEILQKQLFEEADTEVVKIGVNVSITVKGEQKEALLIKTSQDGIHWQDDYYIYSLADGKVIWG